MWRCRANLFLFRFLGAVMLFVVIQCQPQEQTLHCSASVTAESRNNLTN